MRPHTWRAALLAMLLLLIGALPVVAQSTDEGVVFGDEGQVLLGVRDDVSVAAGEDVDAVIIVRGTGTIEGTVNGLVLIDSDVTIQGDGAEVDGLFAVGGTLTIGAGATVKEGAYINTAITNSTTSNTSQSDLHNLQDEMAGALGFVVAGMIVVLFFIWIGTALAVLFAALMAVAFGTAQLRRSAFNIGHDVLKTLVAGFLAAIVPWIVIALLAVTVVGIPLAVGLALLWGFVALLGYIVSGLWIGERILRRSRMATRPYGAAFLGVLILILLSWLPFVTTIALWFGLGGLALEGWRVLRTGGTPPVPPGYGYGQPYGQYAQVPPPPYMPPPYAPPPPPPPYYPPQQGGPPSWPQG